MSSLGTISLTVYGTPAPQGSMKAFVIAGRARVTSSNKNLKPYRQEVAGAAIVAREAVGLRDVLAPKHVAVDVEYRFYFERPPSIPKKRVMLVVKPDLDKLIRSTTDALTGILYADDAQIVSCDARKFYGSPARVEITVRLVSETPLLTFMKEAINGRTLVQRQDSSKDDDSQRDLTGW
jgi:Holliday junction resolvase RusA-like endonuclease